MSFTYIKDKNGDSQKVMEVDGKFYGVICDPDILQNMQDATIRDDDVMICAFMRSGTHWTYEMTHMLLQGSADTVPKWKGAEQFEFTSNADLDKIPSPRVLNTHLPFPDLPTQVARVRPKIILLLRDPRDVIVSNYFIVTGVAETEYKGTFEAYLDLFLEGRVMYGSWFEYISQWDTVLASGGYETLTIHYEDTHKNPLDTVRKISEFLGLKSDEKLFTEIVEKCAFDRMREDKKPYTFITSDGTNIIYRKGTEPVLQLACASGQVSDWKNWFTVAMAERFDKEIKMRMKTSNLAQRYLH